MRTVGHAVAVLLISTAAAAAQEGNNTPEAAPGASPVIVLQNQRNQCLMRDADNAANLALVLQQSAAREKYWADYVVGLRACEAPKTQ